MIPEKHIVPVVDRCDPSQVGVASDAVPVSDTARFFASALRQHQHLLVCGDPEVAFQLASVGFEVTALAPRGAAMRHLTYVDCALHDYAGKPADVVLFSDRLPQDIGGACAHALGIAATVAIDTYDPAMFDAPTARWYATMRDLLACAYEPTAPHTGEVIKSALAHAHTRELSRGPYLYRHLAATALGARLGCQLYATESRGISLGKLKPTGLRIIATRDRDTYSRSSPA